MHVILCERLWLVANNVDIFWTDQNSGNYFVTSCFDCVILVLRSVLFVVCLCIQCYIRKDLVQNVWPDLNIFYHNRHDLCTIDKDTIRTHFDGEEQNASCHVYTRS